MTTVEARTHLSVHASACIDQCIAVCACVTFVAHANEAADRVNAVAEVTDLLWR